MIQVDSLRKNAIEIQQLELRLETSKIELEALNAKSKTTEQERDQLRLDYVEKIPKSFRRELFDCKTRLNSASLKVNDLQMIINELNLDKQRSVERLNTMERVRHKFG